ncbi:MAG: prefoldin subunit alpha [Candidatus Methanoliparum thermophilum]|uniref:Prefoldin subunit alpha n=1 Tax=Methanoliparum thermophilum TaxID=2491083 RepID=A0A520KTM1_METT2|nr:prefoldin subunit alpha [Candidatus Methanoliparum sp. LAM-1]RZN65425.1 MAG: prefoldin subunit alpha [Candidatus Methanoliparum thermophilum]BDC35486.1 hypothetical protein MTLP_01680 [Candidatus Methanoliparum sp. LAM-1]
MDNDEQSKKIDKDAEIQKNLILFKNYEERMNLLQRHRALLDISIKECDNALEFITFLINKKKENVENTEVFMPIGGGTFVSAVLNNYNNVLINIGGGYNLYKDTSDAEEFLKKRKKQFNESISNVNVELDKINKTLVYLRAKLEELAK